MADRIKITAIGGGTGLSVLLRGVKRIENADLTAVVSVADDGGSSGILREDLGMLPPGDIRSCLLALASEEEGMRELLAYRFKEGRLAGQNVGNLILAAAGDIYGNFENGIERIGDILKVKGKVVPVSGEKMVLCAELENGNIVAGESNIPRVAVREKSRIARVFLDSERVSVSASAREAILNADIVLIGPGSFYTSVIPNFLTTGVVDALGRSKSVKVYVGNVMTQPGETDDLDPSRHAEILCEYMDPVRPDFIILNNHLLGAAELAKYTNDGATQLIPDDGDRRAFARLGLKPIEGGFIDVKKGYVRHDAVAVAEVVSRLAKDSGFPVSGFSV
ncbi:MAG: YvcK family protein [Clostridiales Family XIII bacterium]|jgi:uncharacterized cofD-like protein|nr:YvcK family protein [Clostridiales Family XIII bacterium]